MYLSSLDHDDIPHPLPHVGRFTTRLKDALAVPPQRSSSEGGDDVEVRTVNGRVTIFFKRCGRND